MLGRRSTDWRVVADPLALNDILADLPMFQQAMQVFLLEAQTATTLEDGESSMSALVNAWAYLEHFKKDRKLIAGTIALAIFSRSLDQVGYGLSLQVWNENQLSQLESELTRSQENFDWNNLVELEAAFVVKILTENPERRKRIRDFTVARSGVLGNLLWIYPRGWFEHGLAEYLNTGRRSISAQIHKPSAQNCEWRFWRTSTSNL